MPSTGASERSPTPPAQGRGRAQQQRGQGAQQQEQPRGQGGHHQEDAAGLSGPSPLRPMGRLRGKYDWYSRDALESMDGGNISHELSRIKLYSYWKDKCTKMESDISKQLPKFEMDEGIPWTDFMVAFKSALTQGDDDLEDENRKRLLYTHLRPKAQRLVGTSNVHEMHKEKTFSEYHTMLGEVFEPAAESEQMKLEFDARIQIQGEHPQIYYTDKRNLFERAYPVAHRDYEMFFGAVISGLINLIMKEQLRNWVPLKCTAATEKAFAEQLVHKANVLRKRFVAHEISEAECYGAEAMLQSCSYRSVGEGHETTLGKFGPGSKPIKNEPVYALQEAARNNRRGNQQYSADRKCFHCNQAGHYIAQCPRKANGLPAVVSVEPEEHDGDAAPGEQEDQAVNALSGYYNRQPQAQRSNNRGRTYNNNRSNRSPGFGKPTSGGKPKYQYNRRVAFVYENENGDTVVEDESETNQDLTPAAAREATEGAAAGAAGHGINALLEGDEADFIPTPFLGGL